MIKVVDVIEAKTSREALKKARKKYPGQVTKVKIRYSAKKAHSKLSGYAVYIDTSRPRKK